MALTQGALPHLREERHVASRVSDFFTLFEEFPNGAQEKA
jgi:hypothetical protein